MIPQTQTDRYREGPLSTQQENHFSESPFSLSLEYKRR